MNRKIPVFLLFSAAVFLLFRCKKDSDLPDLGNPQEATKAFNLQDFPLDKLSDYGFFQGDMRDQNPDDRILPYDVITPLFSDYAHKKRFIWMPEGTYAKYNGDHELLDMPEGTLIIKTFYYDNVLPDMTTRIMETRLLYKLNDTWEFADYVWEDGQQEAYYDMDGSSVALSFENDLGELVNLDYRVPSGTECLVCHKESSIAYPIGPKPQNLNHEYDYSSGSMNQIFKWVEQGFLSTQNLPSNFETVADWSDTSLPKLDRVRAYIDMNCAHCHRESSHCSYRDMRFAWSETEELYNLGVCMTPDELIDPQQVYVVAPGNPNKSMLYYRLNNVEVSERMPLLGRSIIHTEGLALIKEWIEELETPCD